MAGTLLRPKGSRKGDDEEKDKMCQGMSGREEKREKISLWSVVLYSPLSFFVTFWYGGYEQTIVSGPPNMRPPATQAKTAMQQSTKSTTHDAQNAALFWAKRTVACGEASQCKREGNKEIPSHLIFEVLLFYFRIFFSSPFHSCGRLSSPGGYSLFGRKVNKTGKRASPNSGSHSCIIGTIA